MAPNVARQYKIVYGSITVGGTTDRLIDGEINVVFSVDQVVVQFDFLTTKSSEAAFITETKLLEEGFRKRKQDLVITLGSGEPYSFKDSDGTGFNAESTIVKSDDLANTARSRIYSVEITADLPEIGGGGDGLRDATNQITIGPDKKLVITLGGQYTTQVVDTVKVGALATFQSKIAAHITTELNAIKSTLSLDTSVLEEVDRQLTTDESDSNLAFQIAFEEVIANQSQGVLDEPAIIQQRIRVRVTKESPGDSAKGGINKSGPITAAPGSPPATAENVSRPSSLTIVYDAFIDSKDGRTLEAIYKKPIRPYLLTLPARFAAGVAILVNESPEFSLDESRISVGLEFLVIESDIMEYKIEGVKARTSGRVFIPVFDGNEFAKLVFKGPASQTLTVNQTIRSKVQSREAVGEAIKKFALLRSELGLALDGLMFPTQPVGTGKWHIVSERETAIPISLGIGTQVHVVDYTSAVVFERADTPAGVPPSVI